MDNLNLYLKVQKPIEFYDICIIYQPSFDEILDYKIHNFEKLLLPFYITVESIEEQLNEEQKNILTNFDLVCSSQEFMYYLVASLEFFCKSKIDFDENGISFDEFNGKLNKNNFDEYAEIILKICGRERPKIEKKVFANERQKDIWEKLQEGRSRNEKRNELKLEDLLNVCEFGGKYHIPIEEITKWSLWRIINCYKTIMGISTYEDSFSIYLISGEKNLIEGKHWTELIKLNYQPTE